MKLKPEFLIIVLIITALACQSTATPVAPTSVPLEAAIQTAAAQITSTQTALASSLPQSLPPTAEPSPLPQAVGDHFGWNYLGSQDSGGLVVEIVRLVIADKTSVPELDFSLITTFDDKPVVGEIVFRVINNTQQTLSVYPDQGTVIVGGEQIPLTEYMMMATFGDSIGGDIFPGVTKIGGIWFGVKRTPVAEIQNITIAFGGPVNADFSSIGTDYNFVFDLSNRQDQPIPDELK